MKILSFGEVIWDLFPDKEYIGGAVFNFSANLSILGADSYLLTCVGNDKLGDLAIEEFKKYNINQKYVTKHPLKRTGQCIVHFDEKIGPYYTIKDDVSYDYLSVNTDFYSEYFDAISFGSLALRYKNNFELLKTILKNNNYKLAFCDINLRPPFYSNDIINFCFQHSNILKLNDLEFDEIINKQGLDYNTSLEKFSKEYSNLDIILLTCGEKGAYAYDTKNKKLYFQEAIKVDVVSTVGAGDCFSATFLYNYLNNKDIQTCLLEAAKRSSKIVSQMAAI